MDGTGRSVAGMNIRGKVMGFILRSIFWLSLVLLIIPVEGKGGDEQPTVGPMQAFFAARAAVTDMAGMCERRPDVCETGRAALGTIGMRARESARYASDWLEEQPDEAITTGTVAPASDEPVAD